MSEDDSLDWSVRHVVYASTAEHGRPPAFAETALALGISAEQARAAYGRLNERHALFLEPGGDSIRMAHPFSGIPTPFRVSAGGREYWANCAWDMLGIAAALDADALIEAVCAEDEQPVVLGVQGGRVHGHGEVVHFPLPFRHWYDDLIVT